MKKITVSTIMLIIILGVLNDNVIAQENKLIVKQKKTNRHYNVNATDTLVIQNEFGNIIINSWDKNKITVDVTSSGKAEMVTKAQQILDNITITEETGKKGKIFFQTAVKTPYNNNNGAEALTLNNDYEANIVYIVNVPKNIALDINNTFGDVNLDDFNGNLKIHILHGHLHAKHLSGPGKNISVVNSHITGDKNNDNTIISIEEGYLSGSGNLVINKPVDTNKVILDGWDNISIDSKLYKQHGMASDSANYYAH